jgi:hypothetical protein
VKPDVEALAIYLWIRYKAETGREEAGHYYDLDQEWKDALRLFARIIVEWNYAAPSKN